MKMKHLPHHRPLLRGRGLLPRRLDDHGLEVRRRHDLEHLEILGAGDLAMRDARDLG